MLALFDIANLIVGFLLGADTAIKHRNDWEPKKVSRVILLKTLISSTAIGLAKVAYIKLTLTDNK